MAQLESRHRLHQGAALYTSVLGSHSQTPEAQSIELEQLGLKGRLLPLGGEIAPI